MPEIGTSGLTSGDGKRGGAISIVLAPILDSTDTSFSEQTPGVGMSADAARTSACATLGQHFPDDVAAEIGQFLIAAVVQEP
jgi:hypothetical protein